MTKLLLSLAWTVVGSWLLYTTKDYTQALLCFILAEMVGQRND